MPDTLSFFYTAMGRTDLEETLEQLFGTCAAGYRDVPHLCISFARLAGGPSEFFIPQHFKTRQSGHRSTCLW